MATSCSTDTVRHMAKAASTDSRSCRKRSTSTSQAASGLQRQASALGRARPACCRRSADEREVHDTPTPPETWGHSPGQNGSTRQLAQYRASGQAEGTSPRGTGPCRRFIMVACPSSTGRQEFPVHRGWRFRTHREPRPWLAPRTGPAIRPDTTPGVALVGGEAPQILTPERHPDRTAGCIRPPATAKASTNPDDIRPASERNLTAQRFRKRGSPDHRTLDRRWLADLASQASADPWAGSGGPEERESLPLSVAPDGVSTRRCGYR